MPPNKKSKRNQAVPTRSTGTTRSKRKRRKAEHAPSQAAENCVQQPSPFFPVAHMQMFGQAL